MAFVRLTGWRGKLYVPEHPEADPKKHPCRDCFECQHCSDSRCGLCRGQCPKDGETTGDER